MNWGKILIRVLIIGAVCFFINWFNISAAVQAESGSGCDPEEAVWTDEFTTFNSRWDWNYNVGTGYKRLSTIDGASVVEIGITDQSSSSSYSDSSLHETSYRYDQGIFEARLRCTDDNGFGHTGKGTRGWGFWNYNDPEHADAVWFWSASPESDESLVGLQAMVASDSRVVFQEPLPEIDMTEWHIYRVEFSNAGSRFFVDNIEVASTTLHPEMPQRSEIWIDNYRVGFVGGILQPTGFLNVDQDQKMYIDWVRYYEECVEEDITPPATITQLTYDDFESGWGSYTDGGGDCSLYTGGTYAHQGSNAANIQDNSGLASSFYHTDPIDVHTAGYTQIEIDFWFYPRSMESGEDFWVQYYDGSSWHTVASYARGTDFSNGQFYHETVYVNEGTYAFPTNMKIRFQCDASGNYDDVYIDEVKVSGITPGEIDNDNDGYNVPEDCDDNNPEINPSAPEVCDGKDNNCDGSIDEGFDNDQDGYTACGGDCDDSDPNTNPEATEVCDDVVDVDNDCDPNTNENSDEDGDRFTDCEGDCDDTDDAINPGATEKCDGKDNDCDGAIDEEGAVGCTTYYKDGDGDTYGVDGDTRCLCDPEGDYRATEGGDCDDSDNTIYPGAPEKCDGNDNDCDGFTDEESAEGCTTYYKDGDGDTYGVDGDTRCLCDPEAPYTATRGGDCDDNNSAINPGAAEDCDDGIDNDCDELIDSDDSDCVSEPKSFCGAAPTYRDGVMNSSISAADSSGKAFLPLLLALLSLSLWVVVKRRKKD